MSEVKKEQEEKKFKKLTVSRMLTKGAVGLATAIGAGALAGAGILLIPSETIKGAGKIFAGIGAIGIGMAVEDAAANAMTSRVDKAFDAAEVALNWNEIWSEVKSNPNFQKLMQILEEKGDVAEKPEEGEAVTE